MVKRYSICYSCGKRVEYPWGEPPCKALSGWLRVSYWKGLESVDHYDFCSFSCLQRWVDTQVPKIPDVFLESFGEEKDK